MNLVRLKTWPARYPVAPTFGDETLNSGRLATVYTVDVHRSGLFLGNHLSVVASVVASNSTDRWGKTP